MATSWPPKDPNEILDYGFDWSTRSLGEDTISSTSATVVSGDVTVDSHDVDDVEDVTEGQGTVTWLSGGTVDTEARILLVAQTAAGRRLEETVSIRIKSR